MEKESLKRFVKNCIPWRLRYQIKLQEAKGNIRIPEGIKQHRGIGEYNRAFYKAIKELEITDFNGKVICELGPGQHLSHPFLEYQLGGDREILLEIADFAHVDFPVKLCDILLESNFQKLRELPVLENNESWKSYLDKINALYSIDGLKGYKAVPDNSVDYCFSFTVLEHIRKKIFVDTIKEMYRFMRFGGVAYHSIDFTDHMGGGKNHLRFAESIWEDADHYNMNNYTNRISYTEMCDILSDIGFEIVKVERTFYEKAPISRSKLSFEFKNISPKDLMTKSAVLILRKIYADESI